MSIDDALVMILAGGEGKRLLPLTKDRAKPAVPACISAESPASSCRSVFSAGCPVRQAAPSWRPARPYCARSGPFY